MFPGISLAVHEYTTAAKYKPLSGLAIGNYAQATGILAPGQCAGNSLLPWLQGQPQRRAILTSGWAMSIAADMSLRSIRYRSLGKGECSSPAGYPLLKADQPSTGGRNQSQFIAKHGTRAQYNGDGNTATKVFVPLAFGKGEHLLPPHPTHGIQLSSTAAPMVAMG